MSIYYHKYFVMRLPSPTRTILGATGLSEVSKPMIIICSPFFIRCEHAPFIQITPELSSPRITYVSRRAPLVFETTITLCPTHKPTASISAPSIVILPIYARLDSVTVALWIFACKTSRIVLFYHSKTCACDQEYFCRSG